MKRSRNTVIDRVSVILREARQIRASLFFAHEWVLRAGVLSDRPTVLTFLLPPDMFPHEQRCPDPDKAEPKGRLSQSTGRTQSQNLNKQVFVAAKMRIIRKV